MQNKLEIDIVTIMITNDRAVNRCPYYNFVGLIYIFESRKFYCVLVSLSQHCLLYACVSLYRKVRVDYVSILLCTCLVVN